MVCIVSMPIIGRARVSPTLVASITAAIFLCVYVCFRYAAKLYFFNPAKLYFFNPAPNPKQADTVWERNYPPQDGIPYGYCAALWCLGRHHISLDGEVLDRHSTRLEIGAKGKLYSQRNTYTWSGGRTQVFNFTGRFDDAGKLTVESEKLQGVCTVLNDETLVFEASYKGDLGDVSLNDVIRVSGDGRSRCRTWQMFRKGVPWKIVSVLEQQTSTENAYIEMGPTIA